MMYLTFLVGAKEVFLFLCQTEIQEKEQVGEELPNSVVIQYLWLTVFLEKFNCALISHYHLQKRIVSNGNLIEVRAHDVFFEF